MSSPAFKQGISNAVRVCMNVQPQDRVLIISDHSSAQIATI